MTTIDQPLEELAATYYAHIVACVNAVPPSVPLTYHEFVSRRLVEHDREIATLQRQLDALQRRLDELDGDGQAMAFAE